MDDLTLLCLCSGKPTVCLIGDLLFWTCGTANCVFSFSLSLNSFCHSSHSGGGGGRGSSLLKTSSSRTVGGDGGGRSGLGTRWLNKSGKAFRRCGFLGGMAGGLSGTQSSTEIDGPTMMGPSKSVDRLPQELLYWCFGDALLMLSVVFDSRLAKLLRLELLPEA